MQREIVIKLTKCTLVLYENELFNGLNPDVLKQALRRGKGYKRAEACENRTNKIKGDERNEN